MKCDHPNFSPIGKPVIIHMDVNQINKFFN
jgi:hypothetical protein